MEFVRSGLAQHVDHRAGSVTVFRTEEIRLDFEFLDCFDTWLHFEKCAAGAGLMEVRDYSTVDIDIGRGTAHTVGDEVRGETGVRCTWIGIYGNKTRSK